MAPLVDAMRTHDKDLAQSMQAMEDDGISMMCPMDSHMHNHQ
jgi:hypothetical protein